MALIRKATLVERLKSLQTRIDESEEINGAAVQEAEAKGYQSGFKDAKAMYELQTKQLVQFASLAALGNAKNSPRLLEEMTKQLTESLAEKVNYPPSRY